MDKNVFHPTADQLRAELVQVNRDIRGLRETIQGMRTRRNDLRARLGAARVAERGEATDAAPDLNRDVGGEG